MPLIPATWLDEFTVNLTTANTQANPRITHLASGNILVVWDSDDDSGVSNAFGHDIIGQLFNPLGDRIGGEFLVNSTAAGRTETTPDIAALPSGSFLSVFEQASSTGLRDIILTEHDATGAVTNTQDVFLDTSVDGAEDGFNPRVAVHSDSSALIVWSGTEVGGDSRIMGRIYNSVTNSLGSTIDLIDLAGTNVTPSVTVLPNGNYVVAAATVTAFGDSVITYKIVDQAGDSVLSRTLVGDTIDNGRGESAPNVAALSGGGFVITWTSTEGDTIRARVYDAAGVAQGSEISAGSSSVGTFEGANVVALGDGGFMIFVDIGNGFEVRGDRYDSSGDAVSSIVIATGAASGDVDAELLSDGRVAVTFVTGAGEIGMKILDVRDAPNAAPAYTDRWTIGTVGDDEIIGTGDAERIAGGDGHDTLTGGGGPDVVHGGRGDDSIEVTGDGFFAITFGDEGNDTLLMNRSFFSGHFHGGAGDGDHLDATDYEDFALIVDLAAETYIDSDVTYQLTGVENVTGGGQADTITGDDAVNRLIGGGGGDTIEGGAGGDTIDGGAGTDIAAFSGAWKDYRVTKAGNVYTVEDLRAGSPDGTDTVTNVETMRFSNDDFVVAATVNDAPVATAIAAKTAKENVALSFNAASHFSDADAGLGDTLTYALTGAPSWLTINAATGVLSGKPGFSDAAGAKSVTVKATDIHGASASQAFSLTVTDTNRAPTITSNSGGANAAITVQENTKGVAFVTATDPDAGATRTFSLTGADAGKFSITAGGLLAFKAAPDFEKPTDNGGNNIYNLTVKVTDNGGLTDSQALAVRVTNANEAPSGPSLTNAAVKENLKAGATVGTLSVADPDGGTPSFKLTKNPGGFFKIVGDQLQTAKKLDFEKLKTHSITIEATDPGGLKTVKAFTIKVGDVIDVITGTSKKNTLKGGKGADDIKGFGGNDTLSGLAGRDRLDGGGGADRLDGGAGKDTQIGGKGADTFVFKSVEDSPATKKGWDVIADFNQKQGDLIDLKAIDAKTGKGNQAFTFIEDAAFSKTKGELRFEKTAKATFVYGDVNGDGKADFRIELPKAIDLKLGDFLV
jgi:Ca2+-binding RTX toxin-like protein